MSQSVKLHHGDCLDVLRSMPDNSVDSIVTDPPYGLSFMGKKWDYDVPDVDVWAECLRVLKPGGHLLSFAGARTQHRMAVRIEDSGFELRDMVTFLYDTNETAQALIESLTPEQLKLLDATFGRDSMLAWTYGSGFPKSLDVSKAIDKAAGVERERYERPAFGGAFSDDGGTTYGTTISNDPSTDSAKKWQGWGTALKPALEPITVARKPFKGTVAANVLAHGTGALNIDGCRVPTGDNLNGGAYSGTGRKNPYFRSLDAGAGTYEQPLGRWPANLIHDDSEDVVAMFPDDKSRFFYCAKASKKDRGNGNKHPTVKPVELMRYLCCLVTPPDGIVLDPFMGSGSTGKAAVLEGFHFIGIERESEYVEIARARIAEAQKKADAA